MRPWRDLGGELERLGLVGRGGGWERVLTPALALTPYPRLPPRLRKGLRSVFSAVEELSTLPFVAFNPPLLERATRAMGDAVRVHPEGTVQYLWATGQFALIQFEKAGLAARLEKAGQTARSAADAFALLPVRRPSLFITALTEGTLYAFARAKSDPVVQLRTALPLIGACPSAPFVTTTCAVTGHARDHTNDALLRRAVGNLREVLAIGSHRPQLPEHAIQLALAAEEYNLARQLMDDWEKEATPNERKKIPVFRVRMELKARTPLLALRAADKYLEGKPDPETKKLLAQGRADAIRMLGAEADRYSPPEREP
jgi:hypothetical protein